MKQRSITQLISYYEGPPFKKQSRVATRSNDLANQIVLVGLAYPHIVKASYLGHEIFGHIVDQNISVDLLRLALETALEE